MSNQKDLSKLVEDLMFVKKAVTKSNNILKFIEVSEGLAMVGLWAGIITTILAGGTYLLVSHFGAYGAIPAPYRLGLYLAIAAFVIVTGVAKLRMVMGNARKLNRDITVGKLIGEVYTAQLLNIFLPFISAIVVTVVFLVTRELTLYVVPALSVLVGLLLISYLNIFYLKEIIVTGDWLIATGLITLFIAPSLHPLLALIFTFGLGFPTLWVAHKLMVK